MADSGGGGFCRCCTSFVVTSGLTALFMWLSLRTTNPLFSIDYFYVPALNKSANSRTNHTISFVLNLENTNKDKGVFYDNVNITFFYGANRSTAPIGNYTVKGFRQGHGKETDRTALVQIHGGMPWDSAFRAVSGGSLANFTIYLTTAVRFKVAVWHTKRRHFAVRAVVAVNDNGLKTHKKGVRLNSGAPGLGRYRALRGLFTLLSTVVLSLVV